LNAAPSAHTRHVAQVAAGLGPDQVHGALPATLVDRVDFPQERDSLAYPELLGPVDERPDVLG
jgi:hypothetical protein